MAQPVRLDSLARHTELRPIPRARASGLQPRGLASPAKGSHVVCVQASLSGHLVRELLKSIEGRGPGIEVHVTLQIEPPPAASRLVVDVDARFLDLPRGPRVDLRRSPVLRALLLALVSARMQSPGRSCSRATLIEACWPGSRAARSSMSNRLRVAISTLRRLGLREVLRRSVDGWWLDPEVGCDLVTLG